MDKKAYRNKIIIAIIQLLASIAIADICWRSFDIFDTVKKKFIIYHIIVTFILIAISVYRKSKSTKYSGQEKFLPNIRIIFSLFTFIIYTITMPPAKEYGGFAIELFLMAPIIMILLYVFFIGLLFLIIDSIIYLVLAIKPKAQQTYGQPYNADNCLNCRFCHFDQYNNQYACDVFRTKEEMDRNFAENNGMCRNYIRNNIYK